MNTRTKALLLLSVMAITLVAGSLVFVTESMAKANTTASVATDSETSPSSTSYSSINATDNVPNNLGEFGGPMAMDMQHGMGMRGPRGMNRCFGGFGGVQVSADFTANVTNIAKSDSDVQALISQGFNITSIRPVIRTSIDGNGNIVTKASTANVLLEGNNGSRSFVVVDLSQAKVTKIVTLTVTEIDK